MNAVLQSDLRATTTDSLTGFKTFQAGSFQFRRDEYFAHITWPKGKHVMPIDAFLRALMRDVAWGFFYGTVNFDSVFGTTNHYGEVEMFAGRYNDSYREAKVDLLERFKSDDLMRVFREMISDWTVSGYDPFAAPQETATPWGRKEGGNDRALNRTRVVAKRMVGLPGDVPKRSDAMGFPVNRMFAD
ncbi:MAG TPA: hydroxyquinol 1,2-dioxygenase, partial [bacterium]|nr:hydroxyquinol 1,2-dioxygenase [bacterium]